VVGDNQGTLDPEKKVRVASSRGRRGSFYFQAVFILIA
jgi:hypothetical protein